MFDLVNYTLAEEVMLAYPNYGEVFDIYTDDSQRQLCAVLTQNGKSLAFFWHHSREHPQLSIPPYS